MNWSSFTFLLWRDFTWDAWSGLTFGHAIPDQSAVADPVGDVPEGSNISQGLGLG